MAQTRDNPRKILVLGAGGREHALALRLLDCPSVMEVVVAPGNAGTVGEPSPGKTLRSVSGDALQVAASEAPIWWSSGPRCRFVRGSATS